jgi:hypothetical protein
MPFSVTFDPSVSTLTCALKGVLSEAEVDACSAALHAGTAELSPETEFRFFSDLYEYEVAEQDLAVHKRMREVVPVFLAEHGFALGFWRLYEATPPLPSRMGRCTRVAHAHRDAHKMDRYNELLASPMERFFSDPVEAHAWLTAP